MQMIYYYKNLKIISTVCYINFLQKQIYKLLTVQYINRIGYTKQMKIDSKNPVLKQEIKVMDFRL